MSDEENAALVIKTSVEQLFAPFRRLFEQLLGPPADEIGLALGDSVRFVRMKRALRFCQEFQRFTADKDIRRISTRMFFPILDAASIEDDDEMQTRWAALLANEATDTGSVHPSYMDILKQLSPDDARLLDKLCDFCEHNNSVKIRPNGKSSEDAEMEGILKSNGRELQNLERLGLVRSEYELQDRGFRFVGPTMTSIPITPELDSWWELSLVAVRFVRACRAPAAQTCGSSGSAVAPM